MTEQERPRPSGPTQKQVDYLSALTGLSTMLNLERYVAKAAGRTWLPSAAARFPSPPCIEPLTKTDWGKAIEHAIARRRSALFWRPASIPTARWPRPWREEGLRGCLASAIENRILSDDAIYQSAAQVEASGGDPYCERDMLHARNDECRKIAALVRTAWWPFSPGPQPKKDEPTP